jgi:DNA-binding XRE family transcriptional regulator
MVALTMEELNYREVGARLKVFRQEYVGLQTKLSEETGINKKTLSFFETGKYPPNQQLISYLTSTYGLNPVWLTTGKGKEKDDSIMDPSSLPNLYSKIAVMEMELGEMRKLMETIVAKLSI